MRSLELHDRLRTVAIHSTRVKPLVHRFVREAVGNVGVTQPLNVDHDSLVSMNAVAAAQHDVVSTKQALLCGLSADDVQALVRRGAWRRLLAGTYHTYAAAIGEPPRIAWLQAALLVYGDQSCLVSTTAAEVHHLAGLPAATSTIVVAVPPGTSLRHRSSKARPTATRRAAPDSCDVVLRQFAVAPAEVIGVNGLRVTTVRRTLADVALELPRTHTLCVLDAALSSRKVSSSEVAQLSEDCAGRPGVRRLRELLPLADGRSQSPLETRIRLLCIDAGIPPHDLQYPIRDRWGQLLGFGDLAWWRGRARPLVVEADGVEPHSRPEALFRDRHRANDFTLADVDMVRFTWNDTRRPVYIPSVIRTALARPAA